ncbi:hypothetical protein NFI96_027644 [Prochilodus magdalenae]|nr:hypothetical protein NFI96_027644 [Prochilodus magdalenae]
MVRGGGYREDECDVGCGRLRRGVPSGPAAELGLPVSAGLAQQRLRRLQTRVELRAQVRLPQQPAAAPARGGEELHIPVTILIMLPRQAARSAVALGSDTTQVCGNCGAHVEYDVNWNPARVYPDTIRISKVR